MHIQEQAQGAPQPSPRPAWYVFPNGKMWKIEDGIASGTLLVEKYEEAEDLDIEAEHAAENLENDYGEECVVLMASGREVRTAVYPQPASYVRVCIDGLELAYWVDTEWHRAGEDVMGAFIAAMRGSIKML